jgi:SAM-dependent methyltransferase
VNNYDEAYFDALYGESCRQSWADRQRDRLVENMVTRYQVARGRPPLLDLGCGYGFLAERFRDRYTLYNSDISEHALAVARKRLPEATFVCADAEKGNPFAIRFQVVLLVNVLEHLSCPDETVARLWDSLLPGGLCVVHLPTINNRLNHSYYQRSYSRDATHVYRPSGSEVSALFRSKGFQVLEESYAPHRPRRLWRWLKPFPPFLAAYRRP